VSDISVSLTAGPEITALPVPGLPGPPGPAGADGAELTPEQRDALIDDAAAEAVELLAPTVDLVVLFENALI
jgi:hypothetical protein